MISPIFEHRHPVGDLENLCQPVGNINDSHSPLGKLADDRKQMLSLIAGKGGSRLIQNQEPGLKGKRFSDLHHLPLGGRKLVHGHIWIKGFPQFFQEVQSFLPQRPAVDDPKTADRLAGIENIFSYGKRRGETPFLEHHAHTRGLCGPGIRETDLSPQEAERSFIRLIDTGQNVHERAFPRPVFTQQGMNFTRPHIEIDLVKRTDPWEVFGNPPGMQDRFRYRNLIGQISLS